MITLLKHWILWRNGITIFEYSSGIIVYKYSAGERKYLFLRRKEGFLDLPKGHIEKGEHALDAAIRETKEETGLDVVPVPSFKHNQEYWYTGSSGERIKKSVTMFLGKAPDNGNVDVSFEHTGHVWLTLKEAEKKLSFKNQIEMLAKADNYINQLESGN